MLALDSVGDVDVAPPDSKEKRERLRSLLLESLPGLQARLLHLMNLATIAARGPDPEAALVYLSMCRHLNPVAGRSVADESHLPL